MSKPKNDVRSRQGKPCHEDVEMLLDELLVDAPELRRARAEANRLGEADIFDSIIPFYRESLQRESALKPKSPGRA